ncbi:uncharacterized protein LOC124151441 [Haliotis rufescens]|uniref:uncharacterized protein LOC124151441 n=1 Tax=Haliotis rufescens TaxID=6454 RepID=UPI00201E9A55|nr:uncharacterized protein LOC124151441 [Haliotis rufescens]
MTNGFFTGIQNPPAQSKFCKNLISANKDPNATNNLLQTELNKGYLIGPFTESPFPYHRINPIGTVEGKYSRKQRMIVDLSAPHNDHDNPSLNSLIDKEQYPLVYVKLDDAIQIIKHLGRHAYLCKADIVDAFKLIPIHHSLWHLHGIHWDNCLYYFTRLVFGSRSSPKIFDLLSQAICWIATYVYHIPHILHLLDDFLTIDANKNEGNATMSKLRHLFNDLKIPLSPRKTIGPTTCLEYLGIILDTDKMEA